MISTIEVVPNLIDGEWVEVETSDYAKVVNPANGEVLARVPLCGPAEVGAAVAAAKAAFRPWRETPPQDRIQFLFKFRQLLIEHADEIARTISIENGKTFTEAKAELQRGIENVEVACGIPTMMQGYNLEDAARGIDETMIRQPLGVVAAITPFNFPCMIPLWFLPYALACGNCFILKPSERVPMTMKLVFELLGKTGLPSGVVGLVNGDKRVVDALLDHPDIRAISFVGSSHVARHIYARGSANGKRVQCQGGAKNHAVIMPDADMESATRIVSDSAFGCAGQRCLAVSVAVTVGSASTEFRDSLAAAASVIQVGDGLADGVQMGPVISRASQTRIHSLVEQGKRDGAKAIVEGKGEGVSSGFFVSPVVLDGLPATSEVAQTEIFGPVVSIVRAQTLDDAIEILNSSPYGNQASIFTTSGASARKFRYQVDAGNIGVNIGVAAPMAPFPFSGWKDSFMGVLHGQGRDGVEFYTDKKVVVERWPKEWSRKF